MRTTMGVIRKRATAKILAAGAALFVLASVSGCGGGKTATLYALDVSPRSVTLAPKQEESFVSNSNAPADASDYLSAESVSWEVVEGERGGTIQAHDLETFPKGFFISYTAPQTPGMYHLKATGKFSDGARKTSMATIEVK